ncbi:hypothetical protein EDF46_0332 [Frondihabitans sp. PhB188]|uniref:hypothetical protein n=1 Tax=Frondihabitans sp. PhB188 TaxID=2485200 RepID=UPI000F9F8CD1|nr:hypothetical protein [Frondihabitans sp. PhB188]ROQ40966.1 hypothetical protein EDF46_0332 [Frondihabitans sp. PhB188]
MPDASKQDFHPKRAGVRWRREVVMFLQAHGLPALQRRENRTRIDPVDGVDGHGDILGLDGWSVITRAERRPYFSSGIDEAREAAEQAGNPFYAGVWSRPGHEPSAGYVVIDLRTFATLVRRTTEWAEEASAWR